MGKKGKFLLGALFGAGLGLIFAPKKGSEIREDLKNKLNDLVIKVKEIDTDDVKCAIEEKIEELKEQLKDLDSEKALAIAEEKGELIKKKAEELYNYAIEKGTPVLRDAALEVKKKTLAVIKETVKKIEENDKKEKSIN